MDDKTGGPQSTEERITLLQRQWLECFVATMNVYRLYDPQHPQAKEGVDALHRVTVELQDIHDGEVSLSYSERTVAVDHFIIDPKVLAYRRLAEELRQRNIHTLIFSEGIDQQELSAFMKLFSDRPQNIIAGGGMGLLMEELGIRHIRMAGLQYAPRAKASQEAQDEPPEEDRLLFARIEDCLKDQLDQPGSDQDPSLQLVTFLENPKTTARFLERNIGEEEPDEAFAQQVASTLERAGTIVYTSHPEQWDRAKKNLAEALSLLTPNLREKILEQTSGSPQDTFVLEETLGSLAPDQIAIILADHLSNKRRAGPSTAEAGEAGALESAPSQLVHQLVQSPEHFQILQPMLLEEFKQRDMHLENYGAFFGPLCEGYFTEAQAQQQDLAPVSTDKALTFQFEGQASEEEWKALGDLLETFAEQEWESSVRIVRQEVLDLETDPRVYKEVMGAQLVQSALEYHQGGDLKTAREALLPLLDHVAHGGEAPFPDRAEVARQILNGINPAVLVDLFLSNERSGAELKSDLDGLIPAGLSSALLEVVRRALDPEGDPEFQERVIPVLAGHVDSLLPGVKQWLEEEHDRNNPQLWALLQKGLSNACLPVLRILMEDSNSEIALKAIQLMGALGGKEVEFLLVTRARKDDAVAQSAFEELCRLSSSLAVSLIEQRLMEPDLLGFRRKSRLRYIDVLRQINDTTSHRALAKLMTQSGHLFNRRRHRELVLAAMQTLPGWPWQEAKEVLQSMLQHPDKPIGTAAGEFLERLGANSGEGTEP